MNWLNFAYFVIYSGLPRSMQTKELPRSLVPGCCSSSRHPHHDGCTHHNSWNPSIWKGIRKVKVHGESLRYFLSMHREDASRNIPGRSVATVLSIFVFVDDDTLAISVAFVTLLYLFRRRGRRRGLLRRGPFQHHAVAVPAVTEAAFVIVLIIAFLTAVVSVAPMIQK